MKLATFLKNCEWAILPSTLRTVSCAAASGDDGALAALSTKPTERETPGKIAIVSIRGVTTQHGDYETVSYDSLSRVIRGLANNPEVATTILDVHSPGGQVWGLDEFAETIFQLRGVKRIVAVANSQMASAGYYYGSAASQLFVTPGGEMGSIGTLWVHVDESGWEQNLGFKTTLIAEPPEKVLGNSYEPLSPEAEQMMRTRVKGLHDTFVKRVARNRGVTPASVKSDFGGGGMLQAKEAVAAGMADGVKSLDEVIAGEIKRLGQRQRRENALRLAEAD